MQPYPVHYDVAYPARFERVQLLVRVLAFCALGVVGLSFGTVFLFAYLALPVFAAIRLGSREPAQYLDEDGAGIIRALHWFAALAAWAGLIVDRLPARVPDETLTLTVDRAARTPPLTAGGMLWRILSGLPSALVLGVLGWIGGFVWLWAALSILINERVGTGAFQYLVGLQRWSIRLLAYQAGLVDEYPPFSFSDAAPAALANVHTHP